MRPPSKDAVKRVQEVQQLALRTSEMAFSYAIALDRYNAARTMRSTGSGLRLDLLEERRPILEAAAAALRKAHAAEKTAFSRLVQSKTLI